MASKGMAVGLILLFVVMLWGQTMSQLDCTHTLKSLTTCGKVVTTKFLNSVRPKCCKLLSGVVESQLECICKVINGDFSVSQFLTLQLANICRLGSTRLVNLCSHACDNGPAPSPEAADAP